MKTCFSILILLFSTHLSLAQAVYEQKMQEALQTFSAVNSTLDYKSAATQFEFIANAEGSKWEPLYYHAQCYIMMSFSDREATENEKDAYLAIAESSIDKMINIAPEESEVFALQALYYTAKLVVNPMSRGPKYGALTQTAIQKALALDENNPRAKYMDVSNKMGTARFFGSDITAYCQEGHELLAVWDDYPSKGMFYPKWGKNQLAEQLKNCEKATNDNTPPPSTKTAQGNELTIIITKLTTDNGLIMLQLLNEEEKTVQHAVGTVSEGKSTITLENIPGGTYAIQYFHDANENQKMDTSKHGIPQEKYGFSNNKKGFMGAPKFRKTLFELNKNTTLELKAKS